MSSEEGFKVSKKGNKGINILSILIFLSVIIISIYLYRENSIMQDNLINLQDNNIAKTTEIKTLNKDLGKELLFEKNKDKIISDVNSGYINRYIDEFVRIEEVYAIDLKEFNMDKKNLKTIANVNSTYSETADQVLIEFIDKYRQDKAKFIDNLSENNQEVRFNLEDIKLITGDNYSRELELILSCNNTDEK